jgi:RND family efflux transporter MFP subunit
VIDPRPFQADLNSKKADVARAHSQQDLMTANLRRLDKVRGTKAISEEDYDTAQANLEQAKAAAAAAQAALETSQLNLQWTRVTAPITGRISRQYVQPGNLVTGGGANQATLFTTIVAVDPLYCYVQVPARAALRYQDLAAQERQANIANAKIPCFIQLENETAFSHNGVIDFIDNQVDVGTGTVQIRGVIANPGGTLSPGLFARMRIPGSGRYRALLIPDAAIGADQDERFVLVVGANDVVERRPVKPGALFGALRSILSGVRPGERVIVEGLQQAKPGAKVAPHEAPVSTASLDELEATAAGSPTTRALPQTLPSPDGSPSGVPASRPHAEGRP